MKVKKKEFAMKEEEEKTKKKPNWALQVPHYYPLALKYSEANYISQNCTCVLGVIFFPTRTPYQPSPLANWGRRVETRILRWRRNKEMDLCLILIFVF